MRFSFQSGSGSRYGSNFPKQKMDPTKRERRCLNCSRDMQDDGTVVFLRGFCSNKCMQNYLGQSAGGSSTVTDSVSSSREGFL